MNNYELLGKLLTLHEECENLFVNIGDGVDALKTCLIEDPDSCDEVLNNEAVLSKMIASFHVLNNLLNEYNKIVEDKYKELRDCDEDD